MKALTEIDVNEDLTEAVKYHLLRNLYDGYFTLNDDGVVCDEDGEKAEGYDTLYQIVRAGEKEARAEGYRQCQRDMRKLLGMG